MLNRYEQLKKKWSTLYINTFWSAKTRNRLQRLNSLMSTWGFYEPSAFHKRNIEGSYHTEETYTLIYIFTGQWTSKTGFSWHGSHISWGGQENLSSNIAKMQRFQLLGIIMTIPFTLDRHIILYASHNHTKLWSDCVEVQAELSLSAYALKHPLLHVYQHWSKKVLKWHSKLFT